MPPEFYQRKVTVVAKELLGKIFVHRSKGVTFSGIIVETEAYDQNDAASHSYKGISPRNEVMFRTGGCLYVYLIYGMYYCMNAVTGYEGKGEAVLIRALEPVEGIDTMIKNRFEEQDIAKIKPVNLTNGPGKLCEAFNISMKQNGRVLWSDDLYIAESPVFPSKHKILKTGRVGITKDIHLNRRYYIMNNKFVSRP